MFTGSTVCGPECEVFVRLCLFVHIEGALRKKVTVVR